jgi:hypothetical protein
MNSRSFFTICSFALLLSCGNRPSDLQSEAQGSAVSLDKALSKFDQELTTTQKELSVKPGQATTIPVTIRNLTEATLASTGRFPITLSYKWFDEGRMLPIEGERTLLQIPLKPGEQETVQAKVTVPASGSDLTVHFSLVQEGVAWFFTKGGQTLNIPVRLER